MRLPDQSVVLCRFFKLPFMLATCPEHRIPHDVIRSTWGKSSRCEALHDVFIWGPGVTVSPCSRKRTCNVVWGTR